MNNNVLSIISLFKMENTNETKDNLLAESSVHT